MNDINNTKEQLLDELAQLRLRIVELKKPEVTKEHVEENINGGEHFLQVVFDNIQYGISVLDCDLRILRTNSWMERLYAHRMPLVGKKCYQVYQLREARCPWCPSVQTLETGEVTSATVPYVSNENPKGWIELSSFPLKDEEGRIAGVIEHVMDVTERKQAEKELLEGKERYNALFERSLDCVYVHDLEGNFIDANATALNLLGYKKEESKSLNFLSLIDEDQLPLALKGIREIIKTGHHKHPYEFKLKCKDDSEVIVEAKAFSILINDKNHSIIGIARDITEQKKTADALRESEQRMRTLLRNLPGMAYRCHNTQDWPMDFASDGASELIGYEPDDKQADVMLIFANLIHPDDKQRVWDTVQKSVKSGVPFEIEYRIQTLSGQEKWVWERGRAVTAEGEEPCILEGFITDITLNKSAEKALRESEKQYRLLANNVSDVIWTMDMEQRFTFLSPSIQKLRGYAPDEAIKIPLEETLTPESYEKAVQIIMEEIAREGEPGVPQDRSRTFELNQICKDGSTLWTEVTTSFLRDESGSPYGIVGITRDISDRKRAEKAFRKSEARYRLLAENVTDVIWTMNLNLQYTYQSPSVEKMRGYTVEEAMAQKVEEQLTPPSFILVMRHLAKEMEIERSGIGDPSRSLTLELEMYNKNGSILWTEATMAFLRDRDGKPTGILGVSRNITERKQSEKEKTSLEQQLRQSQKMEAVGRLAGGVAHDFNNILTGINGYTEMLLDGLDPGDPMCADLKEILTAGEQAAGLTNQLLAFSRKQVITPKVILPNEILERSQKMLRRIIGEDIELVFIPEKRLGRIKADPAQLNQVLVNLAVNARDAMLEGGKLTIQTQNVDLDEAFCKSHVGAEPGRYAMLSVTDTGHGMNEETKSKIFEPFFSTKSRDHGTGLGLATVYGIVKQNKGFISVHSEQHIGTTFKVYFPRVNEKADDLTKVVDSNLPTGKEMILLVEDEDMVRGLAKKILEKYGYKVVEMDNGSYAVMWVEKHDDVIDLLLTDVIMPGMNGMDLHKKLLEKRPGLKALFMSGYTENVIAQHGVLDKGTKFIKKPFKIETLMRKVREMLDK